METNSGNVNNVCHGFSYICWPVCTIKNVRCSLLLGAIWIQSLGRCSSTYGRWQLQSEPWSSRWSIWRCNPSAPYYCPRNDCGQDIPRSSLGSSAILWRQNPPASKRHRLAQYNSQKTEFRSYYLRAQCVRYYCTPLSNAWMTKLLHVQFCCTKSTC